MNLSNDSLQSSSSAVGWVVLPTLFPASETSSSLSLPPTTLSTINIVTENLIIVMIIIFTAVTLLCHDHERMVSSLNKPITTFLSKPWPSQSSWSSGDTRRTPWEISSGSILYTNWILGANHHSCFVDYDDVEDHAIDDDDLYIIGAVCVSQKSLFLYSKDLIVSHVYRRIPYSRDLVISPVSGHIPYSRYLVISPVYRHFPCSRDLVVSPVYRHHIPKSV